MCYNILYAREITIEGVKMKDVYDRKISFKIKGSLLEDYKGVLGNDETISENYRKHMERQVLSYTLFEDYIAYDNNDYKSLNVRVDNSLYNKYKIKLIENQTTVTADLIRYLSHEIIKKNPSKKS